MPVDPECTNAEMARAPSSESIRRMQSRGSVLSRIGGRLVRQNALSEGDPRNEAGAILILALLYIIVVSLVVAALTTWASSDLKNTTGFDAASSLHYAASSATEVAIQSMRFDPIPQATPTKGVTSPIGECWVPASGSTSTLLIDTISVTVWCTSTENLTSPSTRVVDLYTCLSSVTSSNCQTSSVLAAEVDFNDYPRGGLPTMTVQCNFLAPVTCGNGITLVSWDWNT
jgi:hypothetical protein